jgi:hypothetical protein
MAEYLSSPEIALPLLLLGLYCALRSITSWVGGLQLLIVVIVFGGMIGARVGSTAAPIIFRDLVIVLPVYAAFASSRAARDALTRLPAGMVLGLSAVLVWIMISLFNPEGVSGFQLLIGLKVWVYYIPFVLVGAALAARPDAMFRAFRALLICGLVACSFGLLQAALIRLIGYHSTMTLFFGVAASSVTQGFSTYTQGGGIYRVPGTFSFAAQYVEFLFLFLVVTVIEANADPDPRYRRLGRIAFYVGMGAGLFSGTKAAFLVFPALAVVFLAFGLIRGRLAIWAPIAVAIAAWAIAAAKLDPLELVSFGFRYAEDYSQGFVFDQISAAVRYGPFGQGIGSSTGAARFATVGAAVGSRLGFESYYAKIAAELGTIGLAIFAAFLISVAVRTCMIALEHRKHSGNMFIAPLAIYVILNLIYSFKGFVIDTDPGNIFFWLGLGMMLRLNQDLRAAYGHRDPVVLADPPIPAARSSGNPAPLIFSRVRKPPPLN